MITGQILRDALISASNNVENHIEEVNALNVFPVPDGDTGTNMSMTICAAKRELLQLPDDVTVSKVASKTSSAMLRGARGNSGVILSLIFRGIAKGLKGIDAASSKDMVLALSYGVEAAYKAVMKPTEGTILTVVRGATSAGAKFGTENKEAPFEEVFDAVIAGAREALDSTPELLPVLKKAGVVDAGGTGLLLCFEGMQSVFKDGLIIPLSGETTEVEETPAEVEESEETENASYSYCAELVVVRNSECKKDPEALKSYYGSIGDQVVVKIKDEIIKIHIHTNEPGKVINQAIKYGALFNISIKNMDEAHCKTDLSKINLDVYHKDVAVKKDNSKATIDSVPITKEVGFVAIAAGEGLKALFMDIGVDTVVSGGQTMNPSTEDILNAVEQTPASVVFVLPNNKNIIMAAEQVDALSTRRVLVLPTRTIPQGITAMINYNPDAPVEENHLAMSKSLDTVDTAQVTFAARDSEMDNFHIKAGQMLGMENGKITVVEDDAITAAYKITRHLCSRKTSMVTIIFGEGATEEDAVKLEGMISDKFKGVETAVVEGGQPVYSFIISVE
ncbi:MAG: DAK2 domain-containing protein [Clostridia bacterium]|nr:DAK2 domain-containing protein [Clostridia bacterium]